MIRLSTEPDLIPTARLWLRQCGPETYREAFETLTDTQLSEHFGWDTPERIEEERKRNEGGYTTFSQSMRWWYFIDRQTEKVIGQGGYHLWMLRHFRAEIGYNLYDPKYYGKGLMSEAVYPILQHGIKVMQLRRIEGLTAEDNHASIRILEKFGFQREAVLRAHYNIDGVNEPSVLFSLVPDDFKHAP